jgi:glycosyltransferase involved in cell wall biosynthesis
MKLAFVVQRYGLEIIGGAEYFTRLVAERLKKYHTIEIFTSCAKGYHIWENEYENNCECINGIVVRRFRTSKTRCMNSFSTIQNKVYFQNHTLKDEQNWIEEQGPYCPDLIEFIQKNKENYDLFIFFTYRYYPSFYGIEYVKEKAIIVPFAENEPGLNLKVTSDLFKQVRGVIYSTPEEHELIKNRIGFDENKKIWDIIGCGINIPEGNLDESILENNNYILYLGRIEGSKGCYQLFEYYLKLLDEWDDAPDLVLAGPDAIGIPEENKIKYYGYVNEDKKISLLKNAKLLIMPSPYESFSLVTLESMACGTPVLVNGECNVLKGHCIRSNAGLWYNNYDDFKETLIYLISDMRIRQIMAKNAVNYIKKYYSWEIIERKYIEFFHNMKIAVDEG